MERLLIAAVAGALLLGSAAPSAAQTLRGSSQAMQKQNRIAQQHDYTFLASVSDVRRFVEAGLLVSVPGNRDYELASVSHPYARPAVKLFVERLAAQYRSACGEKLIITSLTRPTSDQPRNASALSVHPAGMALDVRISKKTSCRNWLERTLLSLEKQGVLDAVRERNPPHYHVALFPQQYTRYVATITKGAVGTAVAAAPSRPAALTVASANSAESAEAGARGAAIAAALEEAGAESTATYRVNRGDSLWSIARRFGTTVDTLRELNGLRGTRLVAGQKLAVPAVATGSNGS